MGDPRGRDGDDEDRDLLQQIVSRIESTGPIPFDVFMDFALYGARGGYYERGASCIGTAGDFYTASDVSSAFGAMVAEQVAEIQMLLEEESIDVVELGAGKGTLAADILAHLEAHHPSCFARLTYWIVERSSGMRKAQSALLRDHVSAGRLRWAESPETVRRDGIVGCVIANEFYDALPVRVVTRTMGELRERRVGLSGSPPRPSWVEIPGVDAELGAYAARHGLCAIDGSIAEAGLAAESYARGVARSMRKGFQIVIDYGDRAAKLYDPHFRPAGTLVAYHKHRLLDDPFVRIGRQDISAHVNFSAIERVGEDEGLVSVGFTTQDRFLIALGLADRIAGLAARTDPADIRTRLAMMSLIHPEALGRTFRVLLQAKGVSSPALKGLKDPFARASQGEGISRDERMLAS